MKRKFLKESSFSESQVSQYKNMYDQMEQTEKIGWIKAIRECINELGYATITKTDLGFATFGAALIVIGVKIGSPELCIMGGAGISAISIFDSDKWKQIIDCAKNKRNPSPQQAPMEPSSEPSSMDEPIGESRFKTVAIISEKQFKFLRNRNII